MTSSTRRAVHAPTFGAVILLATMCGFFSLFALSVLAPFIIPDLGLSRAAFGGLSSTLYVSAGFWSLAAGSLVGRISGRTALFSIFGSAAFAWFVMAGAGAFPALLLGTAVAGLPMALVHPVTTHLVRHEIPAGRRGATLGVAQSGSQVGGLLAGATLPSIATQFGWRLALSSAGLLAAAGAALSARTYIGAVRGRRPSRRVPLDRVVVGWLSVYGFVMNAGATITTAYLPLFAYESVGLTAQAAGAVAVVVGVIAVAAKVTWGRITEAARHPRRPLIILAAISVAALSSLAWATDQRPVLLWIGVVLFGLGVVSWSVLVVTTLSRLLPAAALGRATGTVMLSSFVGAALAPVGFGLLVDIEGSYRPAWLASIGLYVVASAVIGMWTMQDRWGAAGR